MIAVVGPCASGKSTLVHALRNRGYRAHEAAQEHSYAPTMWERITQPDLLIYLDVSQAVAGGRRTSEMNATWWNEMKERLREARRKADLCLETDCLSAQEVLDRVLSFLENTIT